MAASNSFDPSGCICCSVGTGGTIMGVGRLLKEKYPGIRIQLSVALPQRSEK